MLLVTLAILLSIIIALVGVVIGRLWEVDSEGSVIFILLAGLFIIAHTVVVLAIGGRIV